MINIANVTTKADSTVIPEVNDYQISAHSHSGYGVHAMN